MGSLPSISFSAHPTGALPLHTQNTKPVTSQRKEKDQVQPVTTFAVANPSRNTTYRNLRPSVVSLLQPHPGRAADTPKHKLFQIPSKKVQKRRTSLALPSHLQRHLWFRTAARLPVTPAPKVAPTRSHSRGWASHPEPQLWV